MSILRFHTCFAMVGLALAAPLAQAQPVVFSDETFNDSDWTAEILPSCSATCSGGSRRCLCREGSGDVAKTSSTAGLSKGKVGEVSVKSLGRTRTPRIKRHSAAEAGAQGASDVRGGRKRCIAAVASATVATA